MNAVSLIIVPPSSDPSHNKLLRGYGRLALRNTSSAKALEAGNPASPTQREENGCLAGRSPFLSLL